MKFTNLTSFLSPAAVHSDRHHDHRIRISHGSLETPWGKHKHKGVKCHGARCSPPLRGRTKAILTINSFQKGGDRRGASECDGRYHSDDTLIVAISTGWYSNGPLCHRNITIYTNNGRSTKAMVVDECDVRHGCPRNIVDGSRAVWESLGCSQKEPGKNAGHMVPLNDFDHYPSDVCADISLVVC